MVVLGVEEEAARMATDLIRLMAFETARIRGYHPGGAALIHTLWARLEVGIRSFYVGIREAARMGLREAR
jgi:hypothetical protein